MTLVAPVSSFYTPGTTKPVKTSPTGCKPAEWVLASLATTQVKQVSASPVLLCDVGEHALSLWVLCPRCEKITEE